MKKIYHILSLTLPYRANLIAHILLTNIGVVFSIFSFALLIPVLDIFFKSDELAFKEILSKGEPTFSFSKEAILDLMNYYIALLSDSFGKQQTLLLVCFSLLGMILMKNLFQYGGMVFLSKVVNGVVAGLREKIYASILRLQVSFFSGERKGDLLSRMSGDLKEIEWSILSCVEAGLKSPFEIVANLIFLFLMSPSLTIFLMIFLPISGLIISLLGRSLRKKSQSGQQKMGELLNIAEESIGGNRIIKAFTAEDYMLRKFKQKNQDWYKTMVRIYRRTDLASPLSEFMGVAAVTVLLIYGGNLVFEQKLEPSVFIVYLILFSQLINPFKSLSKAYYTAQRGLASVERVNEVANAIPTIEDRSDAKELPAFQHSIRYEQVSFRYENHYVLNKVNLDIQKGETVALVGKSGSGKTTLAMLLPRFFELQEGHIYIDGHDIRDFKLKSLRSHIGIVTQDAILFNDTVAANIAFGTDDYAIDAVMNAAKVANAHEFILQLPEKYQTNIGEGGSKLSGGQRQRLSIARAIFKNPEILILDEATSALDTESEKFVQDALNKLMQNRTVLVIAHRLSTIRHADKIVVMDEGKIVETGNHSVLIEQNGVYKRLIDMQSFEN
ncbi:MAG: ABC transporter ATP-binding protein [Flavobacteriales bacterium]